MDVAVELFLLRIRQKNSKKQLPLDDFDGAGSALKDIAAKALAPLVAGNYQGTVGKSLSCEMTVDRTGFSGTITSGEYGFATKVMDVTDGSTAFTKTKTHADQIPFYIKLYVPPKGTTALLALQRLGKRGVNDAIRSLLRDYFAKKHEKLIIDIRPLAPDFVMKKYLVDGTPKAITYVKNSIPADFAEGVKPGDEPKDQKGKVEIRITSPLVDYFHVEKLKNLADGQTKVADIFSFNEFEPDRVKLEVEVGGKSRIVNLNNHANLRCNFDITDDVVVGDDGYPTTASVAKAALSLFKMLGPSAGVAI